MAWTVVSGSKSHSVHVSSIGILRFLRFDFDGSEFDPALQIRFFTLLGTFNLQIPFHNLFVLERSKDLGCSFNSMSIRGGNLTLQSIHHRYSVAKLSYPRNLQH